jgi:hypothetical protein
MAGAERTRAVARAFAAVLGAALVAGCASLAPDAGLAPVAEAVQARLGATLQADRGDADAQAIRARVDELLAAPLSMDAAVQVALLNNRGLQARLAALGVSDAERVMASRLPNPGFSFGRMRSGDEREIERGLHLDLARLLMAPTIAELEARRHEGERHALTAAALALGHDTRKAWVRAVAAEETVRYMRRVMQAAEASAELARRMQQAGNFNPLQRAREQAFYADAALNLARAEAQQHGTRERLVRLLGLWGTQTGFTLPERLPELPAEVAETPDIERARSPGGWTSRRRRRRRAHGVQPRPDANDALRQRAGARAGAQQLERGADDSVAGRSSSSCRCSTGATRASRAPRRSTCRRCTTRPRWRSTPAPRCARPMAPTAAHWDIARHHATRSCRCAGASPTRTCCATTAC